MRFTHITETCLASVLGDHGLSDEAFTRMLMAAAPAHDRLCQLCETDGLPALTVVRGMDDLAAARALAEDWRARHDDVVVLGTGGSSLGAQTLYALSSGQGPRLHFLDNVDPDTLSALQARLDPLRSGLLLVSKSGGTAETLAQTLVLLPVFEEALGRARLAQHVAVITEPGPRPLGEVATRYDLPRLDHHPEIGGRFSVFSLVGALPALLAGLDVAALRRGAGEVLEAALGARRIEACEPAAGAAIAVGLLQEHGIAQNVFLTYRDALADFGLWFRQLWAESLGKDGTGLTPLRALGTADHHSQLQLYLAGPRDKMFTLVMPGTAGRGPRMAAALAEAVGAPALADRTLGDLLDASARATAETLVRAGRPLRRIEVATLDEASLGAMMMHFMLETILAADLLGVNAFDQPAVEEGKVLTRQYLQEAAT
jgi:glucose-6-phosphate isomerase